MKKCKPGKRKTLKVILIIVVVIVAGFSGYGIYGSYKLNQLSGMTFEEMLAYTTEDQENAVITVGIIRNGQVAFDVYGANGIKLSPEEHIYEIGSITKTFTASLLCKALSEEKISLDDHIDQYLTLPKKDYYPTIRRLVTHTSGYKAHYFEKPMITNFLSAQNSFVDITEEMLLARTAKINLDDTDYPFNYSNFGMAVLGVVLEQIYAKDYTLLINEYCLDDLGLTDTEISAVSGDLEGSWEWSASDAYLPAGALLSNISDMMRYAALHLGEKPDYLPIGHAVLAEVNATSETYAKLGMRIDAVGAGWIIDKENGIIWHNGATGNYNSYIGLDKENQNAVVILSNLPPDYRIPATIMGVEILTSLQN